MKKLALLLVLLASPALADTVPFTGFQHSGAVDPNECWDTLGQDGYVGVRRACPEGVLLLSIPLPTLTTATPYAFTVYGRKGSSTQTISCSVKAWSNASPNTFYSSAQGTITPSSDGVQSMSLTLTIPANGVAHVWCAVGQNARMVAVEYHPA